MSKILLILSKEFPFGKAESFLETEIKYINVFDKIYLCPLFPPKNKNCRLENCDENNNIVVVDCCKPLTITKKFKGLCISLIQKHFWYEIVSVFRNSEEPLLSLKMLLSFSYTGEIVSRELYCYLSSLFSKNDEILLYSYWLHQQAYSAVFFRNRIIQVKRVISRCHGFDVYEERNHGYIPYRIFFLQNLDCVYCISNNGKEYLEKKYPQFSKKFKVARLGTKEHYLKKYRKIDGLFRIVSCSYCVPVKRIDLIIKALRIIGDSGLQIEWTHFGDGVLLEKLQKEAAAIPYDNVKVKFMGYTPNDKILEIYSENDYEVFINVSSSEGIPVSIMEAMSFGIPAIATNVGGTGELVQNGFNGVLLHPDFDLKELCIAIKNMTELKEDCYLQLRKNARNFWKDNFSASKNYELFAQLLSV